MNTISIIYIYMYACIRTSAFLQTLCSLCVAWKPPMQAVDGESTQPIITDADADIAIQIFIAIEGDLLIE